MNSNPIVALNQRGFNKLPGLLRKYPGGMVTVPKGATFFCKHRGSRYEGEKMHPWRGFCFRRLWAIRRSPGAMTLFRGQSDQVVTPIPTRSAFIGDQFPFMFPSTSRRGRHTEKFGRFTNAHKFPIHT